MNDNYSMAEIKVSERLSDTRMPADKEKNINWRKAEREVNRLQARIARASQKKKWNFVKRLQYLQAHSFYMKVFAVKRASAEKKRKQKEIEKSISAVIRKRGRAWSQEALIRNLNCHIRRWMKNCPSKDAGRAGARLNFMLYEWLWRWAKRRHPRKGKRWILEKYWHCRGGRKWVFSTDTSELIHLRGR